MVCFQKGFEMKDVTHTSIQEEKETAILCWTSQQKHLNICLKLIKICSWIKLSEVTEKEVHETSKIQRFA